MLLGGSRTPLEAYFGRSTTTRNDNKVYFFLTEKCKKNKKFRGQFFWKKIFLKLPTSKLFLDKNHILYMTSVEKILGVWWHFEVLKFRDLRSSGLFWAFFWPPRSRKCAQKGKQTKLWPPKLSSKKTYWVGVSLRKKNSVVR